MEPARASERSSVGGVLSPRWVTPLVSGAVALLGVVLATWPLARDMDRATWSAGEVLLTAWQLNWYHEALLTNPLAWIDANIFFPYDRTGTFNDLLLSHALLTLPAAWHDSPVLALNLALLGGFVLCAIFAYFVVLEVVGHRAAAAVGGILFALAPFRFLHLGHLSIAAAWPLPLFFWALLRQLRQPSWPWAALTAASGVLVGLSSLYHAAYVAPIVPLLLLIGLRRGPGAPTVWLQLLAAGLPALALLLWFFAPFLSAVQVHGLGAAPGDVVRYGADLSSLVEKPYFLRDSAVPSLVTSEGHLYPGAGLAALAIAALVLALISRRTQAWPNRALPAAAAVVAGALAFGAVDTLPPTLETVWRFAVLLAIWLGPLALLAWAVLRTTPTDAVGPAMALRLGLAGGALAFVLALGPEARLVDRVIGPAPYTLLTMASTAFEGTRVPARFGSLVLLFLTLLAASALARLHQSRHRGVRITAVVSALAALLACAVELPIAAEGHTLVAVPRLADPVYRWLAGRPERGSVLELPDYTPEADVPYQLREYRSLRHMLASKQHGHHLANGTGRIEPILWARFKGLEPWSDEFFRFVAAYLPVNHVLIHEDGVSPAERDALWQRLNGGNDGWREMFRSTRVRVYGIDRSFGGGVVVDRLFLRHGLAPAAGISFRARLAPVDAARTATIELLQDGRPAAAWQLDPEWRDCRVVVPVAPRGDGTEGVPLAATLLRWQLRDGSGSRFEISELSVEPTPDRPD